MDDDQLSTIAILGAGPIGIEAALYARFLGHSVAVFDQENICNNVLDWGHVTLFTPFGMNCSSLGLSALSAQENKADSLLPHQLHTGQQWVDHYFIPLATSDLLDGCIRTFATVTSVSRDGQLPTDNVGRPERDETQFRILYEDHQGEHVEHFDIVIDASGSYTGPQFAGSGGAPAIGEQDIRELGYDDGIPEDNIYTCWIVYPEYLDLCTRFRFAVIGSGYSAATNILQLAAAQQKQEAIRCTWLTRGTDGPLRFTDNDPLPNRVDLIKQVNELANSADWLDWRPNSTVESIHFNDDTFEIRLADSDDVIQVDHVISNVGYLGDFGMLDQLQLHRCYATGGPMNWALSIAESGNDCLQHKRIGAAAVITTEPDFYIIGAKSYGRDSRFLFQTGLQQIEDVFRIICERDSLNVYETMQRTLESKTRQETEQSTS